MSLIARPAALLVALLPVVPALASSHGRGAAVPQLSRAIDLGATNESRVVTITAWLRMHDTNLLKETVLAQHDASSARFEQWSNKSALLQHSPSAGDAATVRAYLASKGLTVLGVGPRNLFVSARGTIAQVQAAFDLEIHDFQAGTKSYFSNTTKPVLSPEIKPLVTFVGGLSSLHPQPMLARQMESDGVGTFQPRPVAQPNGFVFSASCFRDTETQTFTSSAATATYSGNRYGQDITNTALGTVAPCGYQPSDIQTAYHLDKLYKAGLDGTGQTVAIVDAFGSTTITQDVATFSTVMGLPPANLTILGTPTESPFSTDANAGWALETTLDVEWVHAIAPNAAILLVVAPDNSFDNLFGAIIAAAETPGVTAISNSWSSVELGTDPELREAVDSIFMAIDSLGISTHFSSGDCGNETSCIGVADVDWPASSPWVTGIGGISLSLKSDGHIGFQTSWGNNITEIADTQALGNPPIDPVNNEGFDFGGGGGISDVYAKPWFQHRLPGDRRRVPDISWLADPYTGVEIIFTGNSVGAQFIEVIGGTSLSCPMFSGLWAIAAQKAGHPLGQAAARIYDLDDDAILDVRGKGSDNNVSGQITDAGGLSPEIASDLAAPLQNLPVFYSALYNSPFSTRWFVLTFGTDSGLSAHEGYDLATGLGVPNGPNFVDAVAHHHH